MNDLTHHLIDRLRRVRRNLDLEDDAPIGPETVIGDVLDSMAMVEFLAILADDCATRPAAIEECVGRRFGTVAELAVAMRGAGTAPTAGRVTLPEQPECPVPGTACSEAEPIPAPSSLQGQHACLVATVARLPDAVQPAAELDVALGRPAGWLEEHAGIRSRRVWANQDPLLAAEEAGRTCLEQAALGAEQVGALLVTSEAPPLLAGLAAALHHRLGLPAHTVALEIGGACNGFLTAWWVAQHLLPAVGNALVVAVEAPSRYLRVEPGPSGEAAALFGDGVAACILRTQPAGGQFPSTRELRLGADGGSAGLIRPVYRPEAGLELFLDGTRLASRAVLTMTEAVLSVLQPHGLKPADLQAIVAHGGNGRMPALLARRLGLPAERVWSTTADTGNLGSASLPAAWGLYGPVTGPVAWVSVGAGLTWGAALLD